MILLTALWLQVSIGVNTIWQSVPIHLASLHQIGAVSVLTAFLFALHTCRGADARHLRNLYGKLRVEDPAAFKRMSGAFNASKMKNNKNIDSIKMKFDE
jgi:hypothetical protein